MKRLLILILMLPFVGALAQVQRSEVVQTVNGKRYYVHIVSAGQTVYSIARAYGAKEYEAVTKTEIHRISVGDTVWIPCKDGEEVSAPAAKQTYQYIKVEQGQTLYGISKTYGISVEDINELNPDVKTSGLKAGQLLKVPATEGTKPAAPPVSDSKAAPAKPAAQKTQKQQGYTPKPPAAPAVIRPRIEAGKVHVSLLMPLHLADLEKISTTKFDVDQRGKKSYGAFEYIQFYEGLLIGLSQLEKQGVKVVLNVVDVSGTTNADVEAAFSSHNVAQSDFIVALLPKQQFEYAAALAQRSQVFIVNPASDRREIVEGNPYVLKCMPSVEGKVNTLLDCLQKRKSATHLYIISSNSKSEALAREVLQKELDRRGNIKYTFYDWSANNKMAAVMKKTPNCVVLNIYNQGKDRNHIQVSTLLNRMMSMKGANASLVSFSNYINEYGDIDYSYLQQSDYHTFYASFDYYDPDCKAFLETFRDRFKTDPIDAYAAMANDIIIYFASGVQSKGTDFFKSPNFAGGQPAGILSSLSFQQTDPGHGFENYSAKLYKLSNYHFTPISSSR